MSEDRKHLQLKVQGKYRRKRKQFSDSNNFDEKEFIIITMIVFFIYFLNAIFP